MCSARDIIEKHEYCVKLLSVPQKRGDSWMCLYFTKSDGEELGAGVGGTKDLSVPPVSAEKVHVRARRR